MYGERLNKYEIFEILCEYAYAIIRGRQTVYIYAIYRVYIEIMTLRPCKDTSCALMTTCTYIHIYNIIVVLIIFILRVCVCSKRFVSPVCRTNFEI